MKNFSNEVKSEIMEKYYEKTYNDMIKTASYIYGYFMCSNEEKDIITISSKNIEVLLFLETLLKKYNAKAEIEERSKIGSIIIEKREIIEKLVAFDEFEKDEKSFLAGMFLAGGRISDPEKEYNLEIRYDKKNEEKIYEVLSANILSNFKKQENPNMIYTNIGDSIVSFMAYLFLTKSLITFEDVRISKDVKNTINRQVNFEMANLSKSIETAKKQIADISYIMENGLEKRLTEKQMEIANIRMKYPDNTLTEIAKILGISKSTANSRIKGINKVVEEDKQKKKQSKKYKAKLTNRKLDKNGNIKRKIRLMK